MIKIKLRCEQYGKTIKRQKSIKQDDDSFKRRRRRKGSIRRKKEM